MVQLTVARLFEGRDRLSIYSFSVGHKGHVIEMFLYLGLFDPLLSTRILVDLKSTICLNIHVMAKETEHQLMYRAHIVYSLVGIENPFELPEMPVQVRLSMIFDKEIL